MARERPTASDEPSTFRARGTTSHTYVEVLSRAEAHALSRCAPLRRVRQAEAVIVRSSHWGAPAERDEIGGLRRQVASFAACAGMPQDDLAELQVAVSEALSNAVLHAYRDRDFNGDMRVEAEVAGGELLVRVRDYGTGMSPRTDSPGMGLGLSMIARLCKRYSVSRCDGGGTEIGMYFDLVSGANGRSGVYN